MPDAPTGPESFTALLDAYSRYRQEVDRLNVLIRRLAGVVPELSDHLQTQFDPEAEDALLRCDAAVETLEQAETDEEAIQEALTAICLCVERYAASVTAVSQQYARLAG